MESDKVSAIIGQFNGELAAAKQYRQPYEDMWLESYRAFYNTYDPKIAANFDGNKSELYMGITRQKCIGAWQRMSDILFAGFKEGETLIFDAYTPYLRYPISSETFFVINKHKAPDPSEGDAYFR